MERNQSQKKEALSYFPFLTDLQVLVVVDPLKHLRLGVDWKLVKTFSVSKGVGNPLMQVEEQTVAPAAELLLVLLCTHSCALCRVLLVSLIVALWKERGKGEKAPEGALW